MRFGDRIRKLLGMEVVGDDDWDDLADLLVEGDLGAAFADETVERLKEACAEAGVRNGDGARRLLKDVLRPYAKAVDIRPIPGGRNVVMMLGVNGGGKTTSSAKLAKLWLGQGLASKAILAAGDTSYNFV